MGGPPEIVADGAAAARASRLARRPLVCLVTDRGRLSPGASAERQRDDLIALVQASASAGVDLVQIRERDLSGRALAAVVGRCLRAIEPHRTCLVVNDRFDVALAAGASGVHLREASPSAARVRATAPPEFLVGRSIHSAQRPSVADGSVDYVILGSVFWTASKPEGQGAIGIGPVVEAARRTPVPLLAIGGVTVGRLDELWRAGASGVAGIGMFVKAARAHADWSVGLRELVDHVRRSFDTPQGLV